MEYPNSLSAIRDFFGNDNAAAIVDLPNRLAYLEASLPPGHFYTADEFIDKHTLFPFYAPFLPRERVLQVRTNMQRNSVNRVPEQLGLTAFPIKRFVWLRFCPGCVENDRLQFGETYWHRIHQIAGVTVCPQHHVFLEKSSAPCHNPRNPGAAFSAESVVHTTLPQQLDLADAIHNILLKIAHCAAWLLEWGGECLGGETLHKRYHNLLLKQKLAYYNGRIRTSELVNKFLEFYPRELLASLGGEIERIHKNWLLRLLHTSKLKIVQHPIFHILLLIFLDNTTKEFFTSFEEYKPFGDGPWACLNKASDHYSQSMVVQCRIADGCKKNLGKPVGTFVCECGFIYTRTGPDLTEEARLKMSSVQSYGFVWEESLRKLWEDTSITIREIAQKLGVNELTIKRRAIQLGLIYPRNTPGSQTASSVILDRYRIVRKPLDEEIKARRSEFLTVREANLEAGRLHLQKIAPSLLDWLRRNDSAWLEEHLPVVNKSPPKPARVDWEDWDVKLAVAVENTASQIKNTDGYPTKVSLKSITDRVGHRAWFDRKLDRLPLTAEAISKHLESSEEFLLRRVEWAREFYRQHLIVPTRHQFEERAGTRKRLAKTQKVQDAIKVALKRLLIENPPE
jgi:hypothetical protein